MPADEPAGLAAEWLRFAEEDLRAARAASSRGSEFAPRHPCFEAQQAAEKALKALLVAEQIDVPFIHDLVELAALMPKDRAPALPSVTDLRWLGQWATAARYPGADEAGWHDAERAVEIASAVVDDVRMKLPPS